MTVCKSVHLHMGMALGEVVEHLQEEAVSGKVDLGVRKLVISHVENACSFYAYIEHEATMMEDVKTVVARKCEVLDKLTIIPKLGRMYGVEKDGAWLRGRVEQVGQGPERDLVRIRMIDFGWICLVEQYSLVEIPSSLENLSVRCEKYKLANLKPRGRAEGFNVADRMRGKEWLEGIMMHQVVEAICHKMTNYHGDIMAECIVGNKNINKMVLSQGFAVPKPGFGGRVNKHAMNNVEFANINAEGLDQDYVLCDKRDKRRIKNNTKKSESVGGLDHDVDKVLTECYQCLAAVRSRGEKSRDEIESLRCSAEVIDDVVCVAGPLIDVINMAERVAGGENDKGKLITVVDKFLALYNEEKVRQSHIMVKHHLEKISACIPDTGKLAVVKVETITNEHLIEVANKVTNWVTVRDSTGSGEEGTNTEAEVEKFCCSLEEIAATFRSSHGKPDLTLPHLKCHLNQLKLLLEENLAASTLVVSPPANLTRAAWRALTAISGQLDLARMKQEEYTLMKNNYSSECS